LAISLDQTITQQVSVAGESPAEVQDHLEAKEK